MFVCDLDLGKFDKRWFLGFFGNYNEFLGLYFILGKSF